MSRARQLRKTSEVDSEKSEQKGKNEMIKKQLDRKLEIMEEDLELSKVDKYANSTDGIPMEYGIGFVPNESEFIIPDEQIRQVQMMISNSIDCSRLDTHPMVWLYTVNVMNKQSPRSKKYLKKLTDDVDEWFEITDVKVDNGSKKLVIELGNVVFTVRSSE